MGKFLAFAAVLFAYGGLCVYDALVRYPAHNHRFAAFANLEGEKLAPHFDETGAAVDWNDPTLPGDFAGYDDYAGYAAAMGWGDEKPGEPHSDWDIQTQWLQMWCAVAIGLGLAFVAVKPMMKRLEAGDTSFSGPGGSGVSYESVQSIDKAKWDTKGIALVHYEQGGKKGVVTIDDYIYERGEQVLEEVETQTGMGGG